MKSISYLRVGTASSQYYQYHAGTGSPHSGPRRAPRKPVSWGAPLESTRLL